MGRAVCQPRNALGAVPGLPSAPCPAGGGQAPVHAGELCQPRPRGPRAILAGAQRARGPSCPGSGGGVPAAPGITTATTAGPSTQKLKKKNKTRGALSPRAKYEARVGHRAAGTTPSPRPEPPGACDSPSGCPWGPPEFSSPQGLAGPTGSRGFQDGSSAYGKSQAQGDRGLLLQAKGELVPEPGSAPKEKARATSPKHRGEPSRAGGHLLR